ncbi:protealysin inhibitor emfourin [Salinicola aestuarinus]|uniref:protealysin inhibitor emfourin n=1 Tax=Salinicola aestuarinus TaxID=1949082 RepID=UPI0013006EAC|nr:protealysin inhibitor emfourin [Salinicola aestuarinus]
MSGHESPRLEMQAVLALVREGGFAAMPGLERPRRIVCAELSEGQWQRLQALLDEIERRHAEASSGADRRRFRLTLELPDRGTSWQCELDEATTPTVIVGLWKRGVEALDE